MKPKRLAGPPMTLGSMRELGVRRLIALTDWASTESASLGGKASSVQARVSFLVSKLSSISTLLGSRKNICQRVLLGTWFTR